VGRISHKLDKFRPSLTLALKMMAAEREKKNLPVYDFGLGEAKGNLSKTLKAAGVAAYEKELTMYTDPAGMPELREAILSYLDLNSHYGSEHVVVTSGAKQGLFNIFMAICDPGDIVLFDAAPWVSYAPLAHCTYATPIMVLPLEQDEKNYLKVTPGDLVRNLKLRPHTRLFLINSPCNPTAQVYSKEELDALLDVCVDYKVYMVLDRLYWRLMFDGEAFPEPEINDRTKPWLIQVDGMSKNFERAGGLRIGWTIAPEDVSRAMVNIQSHYTSGPTTVSQNVALSAVSSPYDTSLVKDLAQKRTLFLDALKKVPDISSFPIPATFYSFWDVKKLFGKRTPDGIELCDSDDVSQYLLDSGGVITGSGCGFLQDGYLRICFATSDETIKEGLAATEKAVRALS